MLFLSNFVVLFFLSFQLIAFVKVSAITNNNFQSNFGELLDIHSCAEQQAMLLNIDAAKSAINQKCYNDLLAPDNNERAICASGRLQLAIEVYQQSSEASKMDPNWWIEYKGI